MGVHDGPEYAHELVFADLDINEVWNEDFKSLDEFVSNWESVAEDHRVYGSIRRAVLNEVDDYFDSDEYLSQHILDSLLEAGHISDEDVAEYLERIN